MDTLLAYPMPLWMVLAVGLPTFVVLAWAIVRLLLHTEERLRCPRTGKPASVVFVRAPDGCKDDVVSCSLLDEQPDTECHKECLHAAVALP